MRGRIHKLKAACLCLCLVGQAQAASDRQITSAVDRGLAFIFAKQVPDGDGDERFRTRFSGTHRGGVESLVVLAALSAGQPASQKNVAACLEYVNRSDPQSVYARAVRTIVYARLARGGYAERLAGDVAWLVRHQKSSGGWGYGPGHAATLYNPQRTDNSNSQLAVLALHEAERAGASISDATWRKCLDYWLKSQNKDGGWGYEPAASGGLLSGSSASMTAAGTAAYCLLVRKQLRLAGSYDDYARRIGGYELDLAPMRRALKWLEENCTVDKAADEAVDKIPGVLSEPRDTWLYYYLFCLIRAADETGLGRMNGQPWLGPLVDRIVRRQQRDGGWHAGDSGDAIVRTSFAILALLKARAGILVTKLTIPYDRQDDFFDARNLAAWYSGHLGQSVCWRRAGQETETWELQQSPIVYISGRGEFSLSKRMADRVVAYVRGGGTVVVHPAGGDGTFASGAADFFRRRFADYSAGALKADHPIFSLRFRVPYEKFPGIIGIGDGCRTRVFIIPGDVSSAMHHDRSRGNPYVFELMSNIALYTTDGGPIAAKGAGQRRVAARPARRVRIARVIHAGDWSTNPGAFRQLGEVLANAVSIGVLQDAADLRGTQEDEEKLRGDLAMLWLTGTSGPGLSDTQRKTLKTYLQGGGFLFADPAVGGEEFFRATRAMFEEMFGRASFQRLAADSPILTGNIAGGAGSDVRAVSYTRAMAKLPSPPSSPVLWQVVAGNRLVAVVSRYGVTCPLEGQPTYGCLGLSVSDARRLAANVVLYAISRK